MSRENVELHRRSTAAFNTRDVEAFIAYCDPGIELHAMPVPRGTVYHGHEGVRKWHRDLEDTWENGIRAEPEAYFDLGEHTIVFVMLYGRGRESGVEVAMPSASVARWRDGLAVYGKVYVHREDALMDMGVSEDALEEINP
jgi:ketosteroid isomerase-like protein